MKKYLAQHRKTNYIQGELLFDSGNPFNLKNWIFHDENWIRVRHRHKHRALIAQGKALNITDELQEPTQEIMNNAIGGLNVKAATTTYDEWIYLYLDPQKYFWKDYSWFSLP